MAADHEDPCPTPTLQIQLFGPLHLVINGVAIPPLRPHKLQGLLALLVLRHPRPLQRPWLAQTLWPDSDPDRALFNLRQSLTPLRKALGAAAYRLTSPTPHTLALELKGANVDVLAFDAAVRQPELASLERAVALYRGPLLEGCEEDWALWERQIREQSWLNALERLAEVALASQESGSAVSSLRRVIGIEPLRESAHRKLMQAYGQSGDFAAVQQAYRELRLLLHEQLQSQPEEATKTLYERLQQEARERISARVRPVVVTDRQGETEGPRRSPSASVPGEFPTLRSREVGPNNLPPPLTSFVGRETQKAQVQALLEAVRLVTLTGSGGCGKTRLALEVASEVLEAFPDGVWLVELATLTDPALVTQTTAQVLGIKEQAGQLMLQTLLDRLKNKRLLLLLDNCEHLLSACAQLLAELLRACPHLKVLATSRAPLGIMGEQTYRVPSLSLPEVTPLPDLQTLARYESVRLFVERAQLVHLEFVVTSCNAPALVSVCHRLDGIPLAIELAAARVRSLSVEEIHTRLDDCFRLLTGGSKTALPRQQTLRALIDWSYGLLTDQEKPLLCRLSVFAGGWSLAAAEEVCAGVEEANSRLIDSTLTANTSKPTGNATPDTRYPTPDEVLDLLTSLVDKSLVIAETQGQVTRYRLLETVRQYALVRLKEQGQSEPVKTRHRDYFLKLTEEAEPKLIGLEQRYWLAVLETEHDNLRQALTFCLEEAEGTEAGLRLGAAMGKFWEVRGHYGEGREFLGAVLGRTVEPSQRLARSWALQWAGNLAWSENDHAAARTLYEESLAIKRELGDRRGSAYSLHGLGNVALDQGDYVAARALYEECLILFRELGDRRGSALSLAGLGWMANSQGDYAAARAPYEECLTLFRELGDRRGSALSLAGLGWMANSQGDYATARVLYKESLALFRELGDRLQSALSLIGLGNVDLKQGNYIAARALYEECLALFRELGDRLGSARTLTLLGNVAYSQGDYAAARVLYEESLALSREVGDKMDIAKALQGLGRTALYQSDYGAAHTLLEASLTHLREIGTKERIDVSLDAFASLAHLQQQDQRAARLWGASTALREASGSSRSPVDQESFEQETAQARAVLGQAAFDAAFAEGSAMSLEQAVEFAFAGLQA